MSLGQIVESALYTCLRLSGADYTESFQPGLTFSLVKRAEIASRLHEQFEPKPSLVRAIFIVNPG